MATMTKRRAENYARLMARLDGMGVSREDAEALLRIECTLHRWAERECNGEVETDEDGKAFSTCDGWVQSDGKASRYRIPNREAGALRRLSAIMARYPLLGAYHQTDPRGCQLYVYRKADAHAYANRRDAARGDGVVTNCSIDSCYSSIGTAITY